MEITVEWVREHLIQLQSEEITAVETLQSAAVKLEKTKAEFANAKEELSGIRGAIREFSWQLHFYENHGRLP